MNDKTNFLGYSQTVGVFGNSSTTATTNSNGNINTYADSNWITPPKGGIGLSYIDESEYNSLSTLITNSNNMKTKQVKVAVFTVTRNDKSEVTSSKFVKELWVEVKNGASIDLVVAKELDKYFDPANTVIKEITSISF